MKRKTKNGFTLVELLAVIVILAIILVIAVPKVMSVIEDSKKATLESTAKLIASQAEKQKVQNTVLGNTKEITCDSVAKINKGDYASCSVEFDNNTAKVTIEGSGKFEGLWVCGGTKTEATASVDACPPAFETDDWETIVNKVKSATYPYKVGDTKKVDLGSELGVHTLRVSNTTPCSEVSVESKTACGFVLEFADIITYYEMNQEEMNEASGQFGIVNSLGWPGSNMRDYLNDLNANSDDDGVIYNALPADLRNGIIDTYVVSSHGSGDKGGREDDNFESIDKLYLLSPQEVYGISFNDTDDTSNGTSRQLDYYKDNEVSTANYTGAVKNDDWILRSAYANSWFNFFHVVQDTGGLAVGDMNATSEIYFGMFEPLPLSSGVSPAFRLAD